MTLIVTFNLHPNPNPDQVDGRVALPSPEQLVVLVCSRGPKSLVALDWLAEACPRAVCVDGGITAWDVAKLPTESTTPEDDHNC